MKYQGKEIDHGFLKKADRKTLTEITSLLRHEIIRVCSENGGHLSSNLGIVELTVGLCRHFDPLKDDIIFDIGHQTYAYKLLTGRDISTIRQLDGIAPFSSRKESLADKCDNGHSSTSLSLALGIAAAKSLKGDDSYTICVIGDGSLPNGLSYEALNQVTDCKNKKLIIIFNDNGMSISKTGGALSSRLAKIRNTHFYLINVLNLRKLKKHLWTKWIYYSLRAVKNFLKKMVVTENVFEVFSLDYNGPFDGNKMKVVDMALNYAKKLDNPIVLHFKTKKGCGYQYAMDDSNGKWHAIAPFDIKTGQAKDPASPHMTDVVAGEVYNILKNDPQAYLVCAAMKLGAHLLKCFDDFKDRTIDVGIAEEHAITFAAGLALKGYHPIVSIYSTFLQRGYDEVLHDICRQNLGVLFLIERAGISGQDGSSHQGIYDAAFLESMPDTVIFHPSCRTEMIKTLARYPEYFSASHPTFIRLSHEVMKDVAVPLIAAKHDRIILTYGQLGCELAATVAENLDVKILEKIYPLEPELILSLASYREIVIYDPYGTEKGFASSLLLAMSKNKIVKPVRLFAIPNEFIRAGKIDELLKELKLTPGQVKSAIIK